MQERRRVLSGSSLPGAVDGSDAKALDVVFSKNNGSELVIISGLENWPDSGYTPIGIVVVPGFHNRYGDGTCGIISLVNMSLATPEQGSTSNELMCFGRGSDTYNPIGNYIYQGSYYETINGTRIGTNYIPYQYSENGWRFYNSNTTGRIFWPYLGSFINNGIQVTLDFNSCVDLKDGDNMSATLGLAILDFNGIRNTAACYTFSRNTDAQWTSSTITNDYRSFPGVICTSRFKTIGTKSFLDVYGEVTQNDINYGTNASTMPNTGFWYVPAFGEISYCSSIDAYLKQTRLALNQKYGTVANTSSIFYGTSANTSVSSTESGMSTYCPVEMGRVNWSLDKSSNTRFYAFMRL